MMTAGYVCGFIGAGLTLASYTMKSMFPLRVVALAANVFFVAYGWLEAALPSLVLYSVMILINLKKAWEIRNQVRAIEHAQSDTPIAEWLLPHMTRRQATAGQTLWRKGDVATEMIYLQSGKLRLVEHQEQLAPGSLIGEIGLFAPDNQRTLTVVCATDCTLYSLTTEGMAQLYYQNPKLGFHIIRLIVARLMRDLEKARQFPNPENKQKD
ncbi:MAG: Crp/Fnr family transcriptional regulator [Nitrospiraceae bacterium]